MNKSLLGLLSLLLLSLSGQIFAQTCASPGTLTSGVTGNTCNGSNIIGTYCGVASSPQKEDIYAVTLNNPTATSIDLTNTTGTGFTPALLLFQGTCVNGDNCAGNSVGSNGGNVSLSLSGIGNGSYFLAVTSDPNATAGDCGAYTLTFTGTLPVKLKDFSVD